METNLKSARLAAGLSQSQLAAAVGMSVRTLQAYESGARDLKKAAAETVLALARETGTTVEFLIT